MATTSERDDTFPITDVPFPVTAPFRMQPGLTRLDSSLSSVLMPDSPNLLSLARYAADQAARVGRSPLLASPVADTRFAKDLSGALAQIRFALSGESEQGINADYDANRPSSEQLLSQAGALRSEMQDDFVLMTSEGGQDLRASLMAVALPSGWDPAEKLGQCFLQLHQPVAGADMIRQAAPSLCAMMRAPGALRRYVWTLVNSADLSRHPDDTSKDPVSALEDVWFRCERQTSYSLLRGAVVLFLIRVYVVRLAEILAVDPARAGVLHAALSSMSAPVIAYKSLQQIQPLVLQSLGSSLTGASEQHE